MTSFDFDEYFGESDKNCLVCGENELQIEFRNSGHGVSMNYFKCSNCNIKIGDCSATGVFLLDLEKFSLPHFDWALLEGKTNIDQLILSRTKVPEENLNAIPILATVAEVHAEYSSLSDHALKNIALFPRLKYLNVAGTKITDIGISLLRNSKQLESLHLGATEASDSAVDALKCFNPKLEIH